MLIVLAACLMAMAANTVIHCEVLRTLNDASPRDKIPNRMKLLVAISATFFAHLLDRVVWRAFL